MNVIEGRFDRRATHRIFSEPVAIETVMDVDALAQEGMQFLEAAHWIALGHGDADLLRGINVAHARLSHIREITRRAAGLIDESLVVDPYRAAEAAA